LIILIPLPFLVPLLLVPFFFPNIPLSTSMIFYFKSRSHI
jgi:hypothetical protein